MLGGSIDDQLAVIQSRSHRQHGWAGRSTALSRSAEGTAQVFPMLGSKSSFAKPEEMAGVLDRAIVEGLYAVYRITPINIEPGFPKGNTP